MTGFFVCKIFVKALSVVSLVKQNVSSVCVF